MSALSLALLLKFRKSIVIFIINILFKKIAQLGARTLNQLSIKDTHHWATKNVEDLQNLGL